MRKAVRSIAALQHGFAFNLIQKFSDFVRRKMLMVQPLNEVGNRLVKVDVVFPERIVSVDEESLRNHSQKIYHGGTETRRKQENEPLIFADVADQDLAANQREKTQIKTNSAKFACICG